MSANQEANASLTSIMEITSVMENLSVTESTSVMENTSVTENTSTVENTVKKTVNLDTIPEEIRAKIIDLLLSDPKKPDFIALKPTRKYINYLSTLFVNKALSLTTKQAIARAKDLVVVTASRDSLPTTLFLCGVPIVSDHAVHQVKDHVMRIHVRFPTAKPGLPNMGYPADDGRKIACSLLMRKPDLEGLAKALRLCSLSIPHMPSSPCVFLDGPDPKAMAYMRMSMTIRFEQYHDENLSPKEISSLLLPLKLASKIGKITFNGAVDACASAILPGHDEQFRPWNGPDEDPRRYGAKSAKWFDKNRKQDGKDYITMMTWLMELGDAARDGGNFRDANSRYDAIIMLVESAVHFNPRAICPENLPQDSIWLQFVDFVIPTSIRIAECQIEFGAWEKAASNLEILLDGIDELGAEEVRHYQGLVNRINTRDKSKDNPNVNMEGWSGLKSRYWTVADIDRLREEKSD